MKTLDEVIKAYEVCHASVLSCEGCPYDNGERYRDSDCYMVDALHYLKEYKKYNDTMCALPDYYEWLHSADNPPLTWKELRGMEGKPVWVEFEKNGNHWLIITDIKSNGAVGRGVYGENAPLYKDRIGTDWQAYRKERG